MPVFSAKEFSFTYHLQGRGEPVLFIQGVGIKGQGWALQTDALAKDFQTVHFDNRGVGGSVSVLGAYSIESMADDARRLLVHLGWESAHIVGHSMGGVIAQQLALSAPQCVRSLALLCTFARGKDAARLSWPTFWMGLRAHLGSRRMRRFAFLEMLFPKSYLGKQDLDRLAAEVGALLGRDLAEQPMIAFKQLRALSRHDVSSQLPDLGRIPTLIMNGFHDQIALRSYAVQLATLIPGSRHVEFASSSHGMIIQEAASVTTQLRDFFHEVDKCRLV